MGELGVDFSGVHGEAFDFGEGGPAGPGEDTEGIGEGKRAGGDGEVSDLKRFLDQCGAGKGGAGEALFAHEVFARSGEFGFAAADDADLDERADGPAAFAEEPPRDDALLGEGAEDGRESFGLGEADEVAHGGEALTSARVVGGGGEVAEIR